MDDSLLKASQSDPFDSTPVGSQKRDHMVDVVGYHLNVFQTSPDVIVAVCRLSSFRQRQWETSYSYALFESFEIRLVSSKMMNVGSLRVFSFDSKDHHPEPNQEFSALYNGVEHQSIEARNN